MLREVVENLNEKRANKEAIKELDSIMYHPRYFKCSGLMKEMTEKVFAYVSGEDSRIKNDKDAVKYIRDIMVHPNFKKCKAISGRYEALIKALEK